MATLTSSPSSAPGFWPMSFDSMRGSALLTASMRTPLACLISSSNVLVCPGAMMPTFSRYWAKPKPGLMRVVSWRTRRSMSRASARSVSMTRYAGTAAPAGTVKS